MYEGPVTSFNFMLRVEGGFDIPCRKVRAFTKDNEYEYIQEGGLNDYVHMIRKQVTQPFQFEVERYVASERFDPLPNGAQLLLPVILYVSRQADRFDGASSPRIYTFTGCIVVGKTFEELNAEEPGLHVETVRIAYRELLVINTGS